MYEFERDRAEKPKPSASRRPMEQDRKPGCFPGEAGCTANPWRRYRIIDQAPLATCRWCRRLVAPACQGRDRNAWPDDGSQACRVVGIPRGSIHDGTPFGRVSIDAAHYCIDADPIRREREAVSHG